MSESYQPGDQVDDVAVEVERAQPAAAEPKTTRLPAGTIVRMPDYHDRVAIIVGYTDPVEARTVQEPGTGREVQVDAVPHGHPLVLDLPGTVREHHSGVERL